MLRKLSNWPFSTLQHQRRCFWPELVGLLQVGRETPRLPQSHLSDLLASWPRANAVPQRLQKQFTVHALLPWLTFIANVPGKSQLLIECILQNSMLTRCDDANVTCGTFQNLPEKSMTMLPTSWRSWNNEALFSNAENKQRQMSSLSAKNRFPIWQQSKMYVSMSEGCLRNPYICDILRNPRSSRIRQSLLPKPTRNYFVLWWWRTNSYANQWRKSGQQVLKIAEKRWYVKLNRKFAAWSKQIGSKPTANCPRHFYSMLYV